MLSAVRHGYGITLASREIGAKRRVAGGNFAPPALTEPCVKISLYTALAILITSPEDFKSSETVVTL